MKHTILLFLFALLVSECTRKQMEPAEIEMNPARDRVHLEFVSRDGCKNTPVMLENLKAAIAERKISADYAVIQQATLKPDDPRAGYPTPTILLNGKDIFGLDVPQPPFPVPT